MTEISNTRYFAGGIPAGGMTTQTASETSTEKESAAEVAARGIAEQASAEVAARGIADAAAEESAVRYRAIVAAHGAAKEAALRQLDVAQKDISEQLGKAAGAKTKSVAAGNAAEHIKARLIGALGTFTQEMQKISERIPVIPKDKRDFKEALIAITATFFVECDKAIHSQQKELQRDRTFWQHFSNAMIALKNTVITLVNTIGKAFGFKKLELSSYVKSDIEQYVLAANKQLTGKATEALGAFFKKPKEAKQSAVEDGLTDTATIPRK